MLFSKNKSNKPTSIDLIFDIRNSSVGIGIVEKGSETPIISYTNRKYLSSSEKQDTKTFIKNIYKVIDEIIDELFKSDISKEDSFKKIDKTYCVLASPWYGNTIENLSFQEKNTEVFSKDYLDKKIQTKEKKDKNNTIIENEIISIFLNGYNVKNPFGKSFTEAKFSFYKSIVNKKIKREIEDKIKLNFKTKSIEFNTHPLLLLNILRNNFHSINDFCLFDVGAEVTELSIFDDGIYKQFITIPEGFNYLIRELKDDENSTKNNAVSKMKLISYGDLEDSKIEEKLIQSAKKWFKDINQAKKQTTNKMSHHIFIISDSEFKDILYKIFTKKEFYTEVLNINTEPIVRLIDSEHTKNLAVYKDGVARDPLISTIYNFSTIDF